MIDREEVLHSARLARIKLNGDEIETIRRQLGSILAHIERLQNAPTEGVSPIGIMQIPHDALREDLPTGSLDHETILHNSPERNGRYFTVPKIIPR